MRSLPFCQFDAFTLTPFEGNACAIESPRFVAEQGHWMARPGRASAQVEGPPDDIESVRIGGHAVKVMEGTVFLP